MARAAATVDLPPLSVRADLGSFNEESRTVDLIFSTGAGVDRMDWYSGKRYREVLSLNPEHVRLGRLNEAGPLLDSHSAWSVGDVLGTIVPGSARIEQGKAIATVKFSRRADVEPIVQDVRDGILRSVSVGYRVHKFEEAQGKAEIPVRTAIDWEPYEVSLVPMPADAGARVRSGDKANTNPCVIECADQEERNMGDENKTVETAAQAATVDVTAERAAAVAAENARQAEIRTLCRAHKMDQAFEDKLAGDVKVTVDQARAQILEQLATRSDASAIEHRGGIQMGADAVDKFVRGVTNWLVIRSGMAALIAKHENISERTIDAGEFRGFTLLDIAREALTRGGVNVRGLGKMELAGKALIHRSNYQTTSDFSTLLENAMHKVLLAAYAVQNDTWSRFCGIGSVADFRTHNWYRTGSLSILEDLTEHGEFRNKSIPDGEKKTFSASTKGNIIAITRQVIVNDDIGFVMRLLEALGRAGKLTIEKAVYTQLTANSGLGPTQSDSQPFFHANRANVNTSATAITVAGIEADRAVMRAQMDPNSQDYLDLSPTVLLVPVGKRGDALTINDAAFDPADNKFQKPNTVRGLFREVIDTPRISGTRRYLFADPSTNPAILVSFLEGQREPVLETQDGWRVDGVEMKARLDFGVDFVDGRAAVTNAGA